MRFVTDEKSKQEYKKFLETNERCNFQQSLEWAEVKKRRQTQKKKKMPNWKPEVILAEDENKNIIGSLCVWIRKMPIFGNMMYASRGPVCDIHDIKVMKQLTDGAKELAKKYNAFVLRIEPDILKEDQDFRNIITNLGYQIKDDAKDFKDEIQPRFVFRLDIKDKTELPNMEDNRQYVFIGDFIKNYLQNEEVNIKLSNNSLILETTIPGNNKYFNKQILYVNKDTKNPEKMEILNDEGKPSFTVKYKEFECKK